MTDADETTSTKPAERRSPAFLATVIALPVAVLACFIAFLILAQNKQEAARATAEAGHLKSVSAPSSGDAACGKLLAALPADLDGFHRDGTTDPAGYARWTKPDAGQVEVRCGTDRPLELTHTAKFTAVNDVQWLQAVPAGAPAPDGGSYWVAVDHRPYVTVWLPDGAGTAAMQATSEAIKKNLTAAQPELVN